MILSRYAHSLLPISPSRINCITRIAVDGALVSPCNITLNAKVPKRILIVLSVLSSGATRIWKYQLNRSIVDRYFTLATVLRIMDLLGMVLAVSLLISFLGTRSASNPILPLGLSLGNILPGLLASHG